MRRIQAIIFDFDGTIIDTEGPEYASWHTIFQEHGAHLPLETWVQFVGGGESTFNPYDYLEAQLEGAIDRAAIRRRRRKDMDDRIAREPLRPGVMALIEYAGRHRIRLAVASSSPAAWVHPHLQQRNLMDLFEVVRTSDDVEKVKPHPALFRSAAQHLGIPAKHAVAIEDSLHGVTSAKRAGMQCIAAPHPITRALDFSAADMLLHSLADQSPAELIEALEQNEAWW